MTTIEYLSYSKPKRMAIRFASFFTGIPKAFQKLGNNIVHNFNVFKKKAIIPFKTIGKCIVQGDLITRLSFLIMGLGHLTRRQIIRGCFYLAFEVIFIVYMVMFGGNQLANLGSFGQIAGVQHAGGNLGTYSYISGTDNSFNILLYSVLTIIIIGLFAVTWYSQLKDSLTLQLRQNVGIYASDKTTINNVFEKSYHKTLLTLPLAGIVCFTIIPLIVSILIAFTNYDSNHLSPVTLIDWVGMKNFETVLGMGGSVGSSIFMKTFLQVVLWTLVWAFFATFINYFLGMAVALLINSKTVKLKKLWRTILITTIAVPQFVSLLLINRMLSTNMGVVNALLEKWFGIQPIRWLESGTLTKVVIIVINTWVGIPYTMLITSGILMNIPEDLYESARIDGAGKMRTFMKITMPYMLFVTGPYLISQFVGNINNFNVIYLLSGGGPLFSFGSQTPPDALNGVGQTDLLITWIYKLSLTNTNKYYGVAAVLGILIFILVSVLSLIFYGRSSAVKNEGDFK